MAHHIHTHTYIYIYTNMTLLFSQDPLTHISLWEEVIICDYKDLCIYTLYIYIYYYDVNSIIIVSYSFSVLQACAMVTKRGAFPAAHSLETSGLGFGGWLGYNNRVQLDTS